MARKKSRSPQRYPCQAWLEHMMVTHPDCIVMVQDQRGNYLVFGSSAEFVHLHTGHEKTTIAAGPLIGIALAVVPGDRFEPIVRSLLSLGIGTIVAQEPIASEHDGEAVPS